MTEFAIEVNGIKRRTLGKYIIPIELYDDYLEYGATFYVDSEWYRVYPVDKCPLCERSYDQTYKKLKTTCRRKEINTFYGHPLVICLECFGYICYAMEDDQRIPAGIKKLIDAGFRPKNIKRFE